jgi:NAD(P)-dependent dehydrogenase (short-subunit alcohol dehydrogenase family)
MFNNKVVVITGAGSGLGRALAIAFAEEGARLALSDINREALDETMSLLAEKRASDSQARAYTVDVSSRQAVFEYADQVLEAFGAIHFLFNNAGATIIGTVEHTSIEEFEWQLGINMWGVIYGTKAFLPAMLKQKEGCIVNISSVFGLISYPTQGAYNMSKFAVRGLTECLWSELEGSGVRAVSVHPGGISTNIAKKARRAAAYGEYEANLEGDADKLLSAPPERCAADIIRGLKKGKRRILTGNKASTLAWLSRLLPSSYPALLSVLGKL